MSAGLAKVSAALESARARLLGAREVRVAWGPVTFHYRALDAEEISWFQDHFWTSGRFDVCREAMDYRIQSVTSNELLEAVLSDIAAARCTELEGFAGTFYRRCQLGPAHVWVSTLGHGGNAHCVATIDGSEYLVVSRPSPLAIRNGVRVARELLRDYLIDADGTALHASGSTTGGRGILFCGPSGSGKTTLSLAAAMRDGAFVSGDETVILSGPPQLGIGFPVVVRIGYGTLQRLGRDNGIVAALAREQVAISNAVVVEAARAPFSQTKLELTLAELDRVLGIRVAACTSPAVLVLLLPPSGDKPKLEHLSIDHAIELAKLEIREPHPSWPTRWLSRSAANEDARSGSQQDRVRQLIGGLTAVALDCSVIRDDPFELVDLVVRST